MPDESFLGRWSRRKRAEPEQRKDEDAKVVTGLAQQEAAGSASDQAAVLQDPAAAPADLPNIEDLTPASDYRRFMQPDVPRASRNAAMKKLFTDPHFNLMDGLDTYIDDYTKEDPIPLEMLKDLAQSRMLKLFETEEDKVQKKAGAGADSPSPPATLVAQGSQAALPQEPLQEPVSGEGPATDPVDAVSMAGGTLVPASKPKTVAVAPGTPGVTPARA